MQKSIQNSKKFTGLICIVLLICSLFIASQPARAEFRRGTIENGTFDSTKVVLERGLRNPGSYIRKKELSRITSLNQKVNVYDKHGKK